MTEKAEKLPENWNTLPLEEKYDLVNEKLHKLADIDCDWDIDIILRRGCISYIQWTNAGCVLNERYASWKPCQFVRKKPVAAGKITLTDFPSEVQEELKAEDWDGQYDSDVPNIFDSWVSGKDWTECLERTFIRLELLKLGYEMCWECEDYREDHRKFFEQYFKEKEELFGRR